MTKDPATPLVSVLMTSYNREKYIAEAIESVLRSTYQNFELIIVDDGSEDQTTQIIKQFSESDDRIRFFQNEVNLGDYPNRNKAAGYARGEFIMYVDSDDYINSDAIEFIVDSFAKFPNVQHSSIYYEPDISEITVIESRPAIKNHFFRNNTLAAGPGARIFRRAFFEKMGRYPVLYGPANDVFFNIKTVCAEPILMLPYIYLFYRIHDLQENKNKYSYLYNNYRYFDDAMKLPGLPLSAEEIRYLSRKNKKRFIVNSFKYFKESRHLKKTIKAYKIAGFTLKDFITGIIS